MTPSYRNPWVACLFAGLLVLGFRLAFAGAMPGLACGPAPTPAGTLVAFQLATTPGQVLDVFGMPDTPCARGLVGAMDRANRIDLAFAVLYGSFLSLFFVAVRSDGRERTLASVGLVAVAVAVASDWLETATQLRITAHLPGGTGELAVLGVASRAKFLALAAIAAVAGTQMLRRRRLWWLAALPLLIAALVVPVGLALPANRALLLTGVGIALLVILLCALVETVGARRRTGARRTVGMRS